MYNQGQTSRTLYDDPATTDGGGDMEALPKAPHPSQFTLQKSLDMSERPGSHNPSSLNPVTLQNLDHEQGEQFRQKTAQPPPKSDQQQLTKINKPGAGLVPDKKAREERKDPRRSSTKHRPRRGEGDGTSKQKLDPEGGQTRSKPSRQQLGKIEEQDPAMGHGKKASEQGEGSRRSSNKDQSGPSEMAGSSRHTLDPEALKNLREHEQKIFNEKAGTEGKGSAVPPPMTQHQSRQYSFEDSLLDHRSEAPQVGHEQKTGKKKAEERVKNPALNAKMQENRAPEGPSEGHRKISTFNREQDIRKHPGIGEKKHGNRGPTSKQRAEHWLGQHAPGEQHQHQPQHRSESSHRAEHHHHPDLRVKQSCWGKWCGFFGSRDAGSNAGQTHFTNPQPGISLNRQHRQLGRPL